MIGRKEELQVIQDCLYSGRPEFLAIYGRRRVGKTFLVKECFRETFSFYATGVPRLTTRKQLRVFHEALKKYGDPVRTVPKDWFEAFSRLENVLSSRDVQRDYQSGKRVVFLDELPWMDTARSDFRSALDLFWNSWGSSQKDLLFIVCGSATSWMITNIVKDTGGLYNRITRQIHLEPFALGECEQLLRSNGLHLSRKQMIDAYMVFGGIPYYLNYLQPRRSLAQNIDMLFFGEAAPLKTEFDQLFASLYKNADRYVKVIKALAEKANGVTRAELASKENIPEGKELTKCLEELEQCGFIRKYTDYTKTRYGSFYQLVDPLSLFHLTFLRSGKVNSWMDFYDTPAYYNWCGLAFEKVCLLHLRQIKNALGILGVSSNEYAWRSRQSVPGAQIDLLIDRKDEVINLCEMKYSAEEYVISADYEKKLINKQETFRSETGTKKALFLTMVTVMGVKKNVHSGIVVNEVNGEDLFW